MTSRERVVAAFEHREADRVPVDLAATGASLIHRRVYEEVLALWGLPPEADAANVTETSGLVLPGEDFLKRAGADFRQVGLECLKMSTPLDESTYLDEWGVRWVRAGDGEPIAQGGPFEATEPSIADIERYPSYPRGDDATRYPNLRSRVQRLRSETDYAVVFDFHYGLIRECQRMRGFSEWLTDLLADESLAEAMMEMVLQTITGIADHALSEIGDDIDIFVWYDDMGFQDRPYMRPDLYRRLIKPYHARFLEAIRAKTAAYVVMHNDGAIHDLLGDYVEIGVQGLNPVQVSASGMSDTAALKREFGRDLVWWGAIDTQHVLPFGSPTDVRDEARRRIADLAPDGGYVFASGHNIQEEVPPENVVAMFEAARELGSYPLAQGLPPNSPV